MIGLTVKITRGGQLTIPIAVRRILTLPQGTRLDLTVEEKDGEKTVVLRKKETQNDK